jgi:hypothetical protein
MYHGLRNNHKKDTDRCLFICREVANHLELLQPIIDSVLQHWNRLNFDLSVLDTNWTNEQTSPEMAFIY